jgi:hypothetical protein
LPPQDFAYDKEPEVSWMADHFELWIEGQKRPFEQDYKVFAPDKKKDFKDLLKKHGIPYQYPNDAGLKIEALDEKQKGELLRLNLIKQFGERYEPNWVYQKLLYWKMKFPARKKVNVKHSYNPQMGASVSGHSFFKEACVDGPTQKGIEKMLKKSGQPAGVRWVDYILTTAKTWDGPIKDFKLILKKEEFKKDQIVSTCFPGVQKVSDKQFEAQRSNFAPDKELSIFYFR